MNKIGLIGGLSWYSSAEYYRLINEMMAQRLGEGYSAKISLESVDQREFELWIEKDPSEASAEKMIVNACKNVQASGAKVLGLCANGIHRFAPAIERELTLPLLHIADAVGDAILRENLSRVALLGVRKTMQGKFYSERLIKRGIEIIVPTSTQQLDVHSIIMNELVFGRFTDQSRSVYLKIIEQMRHEQSIEGVILGCTEIPLLLKPDDIPIPSFSSTELHCQALVEASLNIPNPEI